MKKEDDDLFSSQIERRLKKIALVVTLGGLLLGVDTGVIMGISTFCLWLANFLVGFTFPVMLAHWGGIGTFAFFIGCNVLAVLFAISFVPETQGKTLEQVQLELRGNVSRHHSRHHFLHHQQMRWQS